MFKEQLPEVPLPPEPVVAHWGQKAVKYYYRHFAGLRAVITGFATNESVAVRKAQTALCKQALEGKPGISVPTSHFWLKQLRSSKLLVKSRLGSLVSFW